MDSGVPGGQSQPLAGGRGLAVHRRPGYPSAGCVPAEPASVSPGAGSIPSGVPRGQAGVAPRAQTNRHAQAASASNAECAKKSECKEARTDVGSGFCNL